ncbi:hypothetical protein CEXT_155651 [Caerostris extrusa]|uniref:Uncharacterized protein n=1 Tax=Caerostris extrusa TaxID=172846 RepID=A0AAV4MU57_CAEEX|nr:hypothetical protein CEXT_155651 [Caerostris extrusa]
MCQLVVCKIVHLTVCLVLLSSLNSYGMHTDWSTILSGFEPEAPKARPLVNWPPGHEETFGDIVWFLNNGTFVSNQTGETVPEVLIYVIRMGWINL